MARKKQKYYVVWAGKTTGIFTSWAACKKQIQGYEGAQYKSYESEKAAKAAFSRSYYEAIKTATKKKKIINKAAGVPVQRSIAVDAACSGNPGKMEYQGVETSTGRKLFHLGPLHDGTNNVGEFLALIHGLAFLKQRESDLPIYTDSKVAMGWVKKCKCNSKLTKTARNAQIFELITRGEKWLKNNSYQTKILKWETKSWGEIPADFGRK